MEQEENKQQWDGAQRRQQARQERKSRLVNGIIVGVAVFIGLVAAVVGIFLGASEGDKPQQTEPSHTATAGETVSDPTGTVDPTGTAGPTVETEPEATEPKVRDTVITIAAAGDVNVTEKTVASGGEYFDDYSGMLQDVMPVLARADLTLVNFEGVLTGAPYGASGSAPQAFLKALSDSGVDGVQMANSYALHQGAAGLKSSLSAVRAAGLEPMGAYASKSEFNESGGYTIWEIQGIRVAVVALTKGMNGFAIPEDADVHVNVLYTDYSSAYSKVDTQGITSLLRRVKAQKPDITIAMLHWGSENNDYLSKTQTNIRNLLLKEGVDAILGTHPHRVQKIEFDKAEGTLVAYSLGDLVSDAVKGGTEYSIILELQITKSARTGKTSITGYTYTPTFVADGMAGGVRVLRLESAVTAYESGYLEKVSQTDYDRMIYGLKRIAQRIQGEDEKKAVTE